MILRKFDWYQTEEYYAHHDELTGALRRWSMLQKLKEWGHRRKKFAVFYSDFDDFKPINDTYGHAVGDAILVHFVNVVQEYFSGEIFCIGRMGGDEFLIAVQTDESRHPEGIVGELESWLAEHPYDHLGESISVTASVGWAWYYMDIDLTIQQADRQLYLAKGNKSTRRVRRDEERI